MGHLSLNGNLSWVGHLGLNGWDIYGLNGWGSYGLNGKGIYHLMDRKFIVGWAFRT